jgi:hypothetical protein
MGKKNLYTRHTICMRLCRKSVIWTSRLTGRLSLRWWIVSTILLTWQLQPHGQRWWGWVSIYDKVWRSRRIQLLKILLLEGNTACPRAESV